MHHNEHDLKHVQVTEKEKNTRSAVTNSNMKDNQVNVERIERKKIKHAKQRAEVNNEH